MKRTDPYFSDVYYYTGAAGQSAFPEPAVYLTLSNYTTFYPRFFVRGTVCGGYNFLVANSSLNAVVTTGKSTDLPEATTGGKIPEWEFTTASNSATNTPLTSEGIKATTNGFTGIKSTSGSAVTTGTFLKFQENNIRCRSGT